MIRFPTAERKSFYNGHWNHSVKYSVLPKHFKYQLKNFNNFQNISTIEMLRNSYWFHFQIWIPSFLNCFDNEITNWDHMNWYYVNHDHFSGTYIFQFLVVSNLLTVDNAYVFQYIFLQNIVFTHTSACSSASFIICCCNSS